MKKAPMQAARTLISSRMLWIPIVLMFLVSIAVSSASAHVVRDGGDVPFYARFLVGANWVAVVFYRPPECVPEDFNLLDFFDIPRAFDCGPPTTDGFNVWRNGPEEDFAPVLTRLHGPGAVPIWFARRAEMEAAVADGSLTIEEVESLPSLIVGTAGFYQEVLQPAEAVKVGKLGIVAHGTFQVQSGEVVVGNASVAHTRTRIVFK